MKNLLIIYEAMILRHRVRMNFMSNQSNILCIVISIQYYSLNKTKYMLKIIISILIHKIMI